MYFCCDFCVVFPHFPLFPPISVFPVPAVCGARGGSRRRCRVRPCPALSGRSLGWLRRRLQSKAGGGAGGVLGVPRRRLGRDGVTPTPPGTPGSDRAPQGGLGVTGGSRTGDGLGGTNATQGDPRGAQPPPPTSGGSLRPPQIPTHSPPPKVCPGLGGPGGSPWVLWGGTWGPCGVPRVLWGRTWGAPWGPRAQVHL